MGNGQQGWRAGSDFLLPTAYCLLPTAYCLFPTALMSASDEAKRKQAFLAGLATTYSPVS